MQELIQSLEQKIGLDSDKAKEVATHVLDFFKSKLPSSLHDHLDNAASGGDANSGGLLQSAEAKLGQMFGGSKTTT